MTTSLRRVRESPDQCVPGRQASSEGDSVSCSGFHLVQGRPTGARPAPDRAPTGGRPGWLGPRPDRRRNRRGGGVDRGWPGRAARRRNRPPARRRCARPARRSDPAARSSRCGVTSSRSTRRARWTLSWVSPQPEGLADLPPGEPHLVPVHAPRPRRSCSRAHRGDRAAGGSAAAAHPDCGPAPHGRAGSPARCRRR